MTNAEVVHKVIRAVEDRDPVTLFSLYHDEIEFHDAPSLPYGGSMRGKAELERQLDTTPETTWIGTWGPLQPSERERRMDARVVAERGHEVVALYRLRAVAPDGERFDAPVLALYEVREGKLARAQMFHFDTAAVTRFLQRAAGSAADQQQAAEIGPRAAARR